MAKHKIENNWVCYNCKKILKNEYIRVHNKYNKNPLQETRVCNQHCLEQSKIKDIRKIKLQEFARECLKTYGKRITFILDKEGYLDTILTT